jgi:transcriptional regulator with XRE-family HTH domain
MESTTDTAFGATFRAYRLAAGLTQEAVAERAGVSPRTIRALERGTNQPQAATLDRLSAALGLQGAERAALVTAGRPAPRRRASSPHVPPLPNSVPPPLTALLVLFRYFLSAPLETVLAMRTSECTPPEGLRTPLGKLTK